MRRIMRSRSRLRMILNRKYGDLFMFHALTGAVIQIDVCQFHLFIGDRVYIHREPMILCRNIHASSSQIDHGLIAAVMSEF